MDYSPSEGHQDRIVCGPEAEQFLITGMPAFDISHIDAELRGYFGIHVGSWLPWLPILMRDGYCSGDIYIFEIDVDAAYDDGIEFYEMPDPHVIDPEAPSSTLIFSTLKVIPPKYLKLEKKMTEKEARAYYQEEGEFDEDSGEWIHPFDI